jgi:hypothetical protein
MVRAPRRNFAAPFVVTTLAACSGSHTSNPPAPEPPHWNPSPPQTPPPTDPQTPPTTTGPSDPSGEPGPTDTKNAPQAATYDHHWIVSKRKNTGTCQAFLDPNCPKAEPGKPVPTCNPPPPIKYDCPEGFTDTDTLKIILRTGETDCWVERAPIKCPPNAKCNPPPPRKVSCPGS